MGESREVIDIQDLSLLKITKVKTWAIYFDYGNKHYLLHNKLCDEYEEIHELYERNINKNGFYSLNFIKSSYARSSVLNDYIKPISWKTIVYNQIDKEYFRDKLVVNGFAKSIKMGKLKIDTVQEINTVQDLINVLRKFPMDMEVRDYDFMEIEDVKIQTWHHDNYPYDKPDKDYVCIC